MNIAALLEKSARSFPENPALALGTQTVATYRDYADRAARMAAGLIAKYGLSPGDRVAVAMKNSPDYATALLAIWHAGLAAVPMNAKLHPREFGYILENSGAAVCFVSEDLETAVADAAADAPNLKAVIRDGSRDWQALMEHDAMPLADAGPDDLAWLFYTSGTTGRPKGAMLSHRNLLTMTLSYFADVDPVGADEAIIHAAPMSHGSGLYIFPYLAKAACQVVPDSGGFEPDEIFELIAAHPNSGFFFAPTMVTRLINAPGVGDADTSNLKTLVYGGGPMYAADCIKALDILGPKLVQIYGQGESPMNITVLTREMHLDRDHPRYMDRLASVGIARSDCQVRVVDEDDVALPAGEVGEIVVRGDIVMKGYWNNPDASAETLKGGWLHTGDMGAFDNDGFLTLKDRSKDVIISGGSNIYPREVEEVLLRHPDVLEVSVVGRPHADWGEEVIAFVVPREGRDVPEAELDTLCLENIARFKRPKAYRTIEALPKNNYGKVLKTALREELSES